VRRAVDAALHYHVFAAQAAAVYDERGDLAAIGREAVATDCEPLRVLIARNAARLGMNGKDAGLVGLFAATEGGPALRECASEKIAEAEARARAPR
jgi:hypothetical protein